MLISNNSIFKRFNQGLIPILLIVFYSTEAIYKYMLFTEGINTILSKCAKGLLITYILLILIVTQKWKILKSILLITIIFSIGQLLITPNFNFYVLVNFIKYIFPILLFAYFNSFITEESKKLIFKIFEKLIIFNSLLIIMGAILDIYILNTYIGPRFGFNGLLVTSATSTYFYIIALIYLFLKYRHAFFRQPLVILCIIGALLLGTKSIYLFILFVFFIYTYFYVNLIINRYIYLGLFIVMVLSFYYMFFEYEIFNSLRKKEGLLTAIMSKRDKIFNQKTLPFIKDNWEGLNYFFGGINDVSSRPQMCVIDILYYFGLIGAFIYLKTFVKEFINFELKKSHIIFICIISLISIITGNFFINASIPIYLLVLKTAFQNFDLRQ